MVTIPCDLNVDLYDLYAAIIWSASSVRYVLVWKSCCACKFDVAEAEKTLTNNRPKRPEPKQHTNIVFVEHLINMITFDTASFL